MGLAIDESDVVLCTCFSSLSVHQSWSKNENLYALLGTFISLTDNTCMTEMNYVPVIDEDDLTDVLGAVQDLASKWKSLGLALRLREPSITTIASNNNDPAQGLKEVLKDWLKQKYDTQKYGMPSWELLCKVVEARVGGDNPALANKIRHEKKKEKKL